MGSAQRPHRDRIRRPYAPMHLWCFRQRSRNRHFWLTRALPGSPPGGFAGSADRSTANQAGIDGGRRRLRKRATGEGSGWASRCGEMAPRRGCTAANSRPAPLADGSVGGRLANEAAGVPGRRRFRITVARGLHRFRDRDWDRRSIHRWQRRGQPQPGRSLRP